MRILERLPLPFLRERRSSRRLEQWRERKRAEKRAEGVSEGEIDREIRDEEQAIDEYESTLADENRRLASQTRLTKIAERIEVPLPSFPTTTALGSPYWERARHARAYMILTYEGLTKLRRDIRRERRDRCEFLIRALPAITGIIGALTGLVSVLFLLSRHWKA